MKNNKRGFKMSITLDHTVVYAKNHDTSANEFADVMGLPLGRIKGVGYDFTAVHVNSELAIYFMDKKSESLEQHMAFNVDGQTFNQILKRLKKMTIAFGNSPFDTSNQKTDHDFAPRGLFWRNTDLCLFEVMCYER